MEITPMSQNNFKDFSQLYRAAFAEPNPERKLVLLSEVRKAIDEWGEQMLQNWVASPAKGSSGPETLVSARQ
jgi:hypothetical protein